MAGVNPSYLPFVIWRGGGVLFLEITYRGYLSDIHLFFPLVDKCLWNFDAVLLGRLCEKITGTCFDTCTKIILFLSFLV
jgi:hypothetical protein